METILEILGLAGNLEPGFHLSIENEPHMPLLIEDMRILGPHGWPITLSVAHHGGLNGTAGHDLEMLFEMALDGEQVTLFPYCYRNDNAGVEEYSMWRKNGKVTVDQRVAREHFQLARTWDRNLRDKGFVEAFRKAQERRQECKLQAGIAAFGSQLALLHEASSPLLDNADQKGLNGLAPRVRLAMFRPQHTALGTGPTATTPAPPSCCLPAWDPGGR